MINNFSRIITYLRKQKGLSQKQVSEELGISQSLLSHYEKGIRECGLDFLVKIANYYNVSTDYLLGRTQNPSGNTPTAEDIPSENQVKDIFQGKTDNYCLYNKKLITNTAGVIYNILSQVGNKKLSKYVSQYLMTAEYKVLRTISSFNSADKSSSIPYQLTADYCQTSMAMDMLKIEELKTTQSGKINVNLAYDKLAEQYPDSYSSIFGVVRASEDTIKQRFKL
ncbi:MAG: helix-turn-helix domain-containing protein [Ruminococcus sp.]